MIRRRCFPVQLVHAIEDALARRQSSVLVRSDFHREETIKSINDKRAGYSSGRSGIRSFCR